MKCNAQPCKSFWSVADLKLLCPHSLRSSPSPSLPLSLSLAPTAMPREGPRTLQRHSAAHRRSQSIGRLCALRTTVLLPWPSIPASDGHPPPASRSDFGCVRSSGFHLCVRCAPPSSSIWLSLSHPTVGCIESSSIRRSFLKQLK